MIEIYKEFALDVGLFASSTILILISVFLVSCVTFFCGWALHFLYCDAYMKYNSKKENKNGN